MEVKKLYQVEGEWRHGGDTVGILSFIVRGVFDLHDFNQ